MSTRYRIEFDFVAADKRQAKQVFDDLISASEGAFEESNVVAARLRAPREQAKAAKQEWFSQLTGGN